MSILVTIEAMNNGSFRVDRRKFLITAATIGVAAAIAEFIDLGSLMRRPTPTTPLINLRGGYFTRPPELANMRFSRANVMLNRAVFDWNLESGETRFVRTATAPHVVETHSSDRNISVFATKRTDTVSLVDWRKEEETAKHVLPDGEYFYGHATFCENGSVIILPVWKNRGAPGLAIFENPSLNQIGFVETPRGIPHEPSQRGGDKFLFGVGNSPTAAAAFGFFDLNARTTKYFDSEFGAGPSDIIISHLKDCGDRVIANAQHLEKAKFVTAHSFRLTKITSPLKRKSNWACRGLRQSC